MHGGASPGGDKSPHFRTGLWSKYVRDEAEAIEFEEWLVKFEWLKPHPDEAFVVFRAMKLLMVPGVPPLDALDGLDRISRVKGRYKIILDGLPVKVQIDDAGTKRLVDGVVAVLTKYLPAETRDEALNELRLVVRESRPG